MAENLHVQESEERLWSHFVVWLKSQIDDVLDQQKYFHMAVPGGATPAGLFRYLASRSADHLPWDRIHFWWTDERCVEAQDPRSNYGMAQQELLNPRQIAPEQIHQIPGELEPSKAAVYYAIKMEDHLPRRASSIPYFDLVLLGVGQDGHTASLFPHTQVREPHPWAVLSQHDGMDRVSLPYDVITASTRVAFLVTGRHKSDVVKRIWMSRHEEQIELPAVHVFRKRPDVFWFMDQAAAQGIADLS